MLSKMFLIKLYKPILKKGVHKYKKSLDYCSFSPDQIAKCRFNLACYWHDRQYRDEIVNRRSRLMADIDLFFGIIVECFKVRPTSIIWSWWIARTYFRAVRVLGGKFYI